MVNYIIRRILILPVILFGVTALIFGMLQFLSPEERSALYVRDIPKNARFPEPPFLPLAIVIFLLVDLRQIYSRLSFSPDRDGLVLRDRVLE